MKQRKYIPPPPGWVTNKPSPKPKKVRIKHEHAPRLDATAPLQRRIRNVTIDETNIICRRVSALVARVSEVSGVDARTIVTFRTRGPDTDVKRVIRVARQTVLYLCWRELLPHKVVAEVFGIQSSNVSFTGRKFAQLQHPPKDVLDLVRRVQGA